MRGILRGTDSDDVKTRTGNLGAIFIIVPARCAAHPHHARTTMRLTRTLGFAGALILAAIVGGTLIGSAFASDHTDASAARSEYCNVFDDAMASELGVTTDALAAARQSAAGTTIDAAVEAGDLSAERADALRERIADGDGSGCGWLGRAFAKGFGHGLARGFLGGNVFEAAAAALGLESSELIGQLREAGSLQALAEEQGVPYDEVKTSVLAAVQADLEAAVAKGLDQERADAVIERLTTWLDNGGEAGGFGRGHFGPGRGFGPWGDRGSDADAGESGT